MIEATYKITQEEFVEAQTIWCKPAVKKLPGYWLLQSVSVVFGAFLGWSFRYLPLWLILAITISFLSIQGVVYWRKKFLRKYNYQRNAFRMEQVHSTIDDSGYRDERDGVCGGWMSWIAFNGWKEGNQVFVLGRFLAFITIPKAALTAEQENELRSLLAANVGPDGVVR